jgi:hypothetical protein
MAAAISATSSAQRTLPLNLQRVDRLPRYDHDVRYTLHTSPMPLSGTYVLYRSADPRISFVLTRIRYTPETALQPVFETQYFQYDDREDRFELVELTNGRFVPTATRFSDLASIFEWAGPHFLTPQAIHQIMEKQQEILWTSSNVPYSYLHDAHESLKRAPKGVFFIAYDPQSTSQQFTLYVKAKDALRPMMYPMSITADGRIQIREMVVLREFDHFQTLKDSLHLRQGLLSWETEQQHISSPSAIVDTDNIPAPKRKAQSSDAIDSATRIKH